MQFSERTGKGIRIAVIDSGVHSAHPHVGGVSAGIAIRDDGSIVDDDVDRLGHGTAVTAAIREKAPDADIFAIKVFWQSLATDVATLVRAIEEATLRGAGVINLSLGTADMRHRAPLEAAVATAHSRGAFVVAAYDDAGVSWLPGCLDGVVGVRADWTRDRHTFDVAMDGDRPLLVTSAYPRDIPGIPRERNLSGVSFAVANATGFVARALEEAPGMDFSGLFGLLETAALTTLG
jgi:subtilisin family serine protease